jgi:integrase
MKVQLDRVGFRERLAPRRDPYFQRVAQGRYVGFRKMVTDTPGTWLARFYDGESYAHKPLGDFATLEEKERFDAAKKAAEEWFTELDMGASTKATSVKAACEAYVKKLRAESGETAARNAEGFLRRLVYKDKLAKILLSDLKKTNCLAWRDRVLKLSETKSSFNRNITPLRAALNLAMEHGSVSSDQAWLAALKPLKDANNRRTLYLDRDKRRSLIESASEEARPFLKTLNFLPLRPGEAAALRRKNFQPAQQSLEVPEGKTKTRTIPLSDDAVAHFAACAKGKHPDAWLLSRADGSQWKKEAWRDEVKAAVRKAKLPRSAVAYTLRHSTITDLIVGGLDTLTVARISGTSLMMVEKNYGHLRAAHAKEHLQKLALA